MRSPVAVVTTGIAVAALLLATSAVVLSLPRVQGPLARPPASGAPRADGRRAAPATALEGRRMLRLRGGVPVSDEESTESSKADEPAKEPAAADATGDGGEPTADEAEKNAEQDEGGTEGEEAEGSEDGEGAAAVMERPKPTPEVVRQMNERMWEAAQEGNEPLLAKVLAGGANVNAFCRGPDRWLNISIGEIAGADEAHTGLNAHWMELNNFTALHLAAACGNAGIIDALLEAGADINAECLQRVHPFPTHHGSMLSFLTNAKPMIFKCTPLRLARAANCGRCFYTS